VVNLATTLPSAPGYIGTFDGPGIEVLRVFGVQPSVAAAYTLVLHAALWLPITLLGLWYMAQESLRWRDIGQAVAEVNPDSDDDKPPPQSESLTLPVSPNSAEKERI
jgi:hypothetical protein